MGRITYSQMIVAGALVAYKHMTGNLEGTYICAKSWFSGSWVIKRLNGLNGVYIEGPYQKGEKWVLNGEAWDGDWIKIGD